MHRFKRTAFQNICKRYWGFVPLTEEVLCEYESQGVTLYDIAKEFKFQE